MAIIRKHMLRDGDQTIRVVPLCTVESHVKATPGTEYLLAKTIVVVTDGYTKEQRIHYSHIFEKIFAQTGTNMHYMVGCYLSLHYHTYRDIANSSTNGKDESM